MIAEAEQEAKIQLEREGKKMSPWVAKYFFSERDVAGKILWKKIRNIDPKDTENFGKYLQDLKEKRDIIIEVASDAEDSFEDSNTEVETKREHDRRLRKMVEEGYTSAQIFEMTMNKWNGKKTNKTD